MKKLKKPLNIESKFTQTNRTVCPLEKNRFKQKCLMWTEKILSCSILSIRPNFYSFQQMLMMIP